MPVRHHQPVRQARRRRLVMAMACAPEASMSPALASNCDAGAVAASGAMARDHRLPGDCIRLAVERLAAVLAREREAWCDIANVEWRRGLRRHLEVRS